MKVVVGGLVGVLLLAGCVAPSAPITGLDAQVFKVVMDDAFSVATARQLGKDCPRLEFDEVAEGKVVAKTADKVIKMFDGDLVRAAHLINTMKRRVMSGSEPEADRRVIAYLAANNYRPGDAATACRIGDKERRQSSIIGQLLLRE